MSKLVHLCTTCQHQKSWHQPATSGRGFVDCRCCLKAAPFEGESAPTLLPTWSFPDLQVEGVFQPGTTRNAGTAAREPLCGCAACHAAAEVSA